MSDRDWLVRASEAIKERGTPEVDHKSAAWPRIGDIRLARAMDFVETPSRLVCVVDVDARLGVVRAALLTNEMDLATDVDCELTPDDTGLPFRLLAHGDIIVPLFIVQLDGRVGSVSGELVRLVRAALETEGHEIPASRKGLPMRDQSDIRWAFKEDELEIAQRLAAECALSAVDGHATDRGEIDPALLGYPGDDPVAQQRRVLGLASLSNADWALSPDSVAELLEGGALSLEANCATTGLEVDACYSLVTSIQRLLPASEPGLEPHDNHAGVELSGRKQSHPSHMAALRKVVGRHGAKGRRIVRLASSADLWEIPMETNAAIRALVDGRTIQLVAMNVLVRELRKDELV